MSMNSLAFLGFLSAAVVLYYLVPRRFGWYVLLAASAVFYCSYSVKAGVYLVFTILLTYAAALGLSRLSRLQKERSAQAPDRQTRIAVKKTWVRRKRLLLGLVLALNFLTLLVLKYLDAWLGTLNLMLERTSASVRFGSLGLLLPLGISFYIFQTAGYLIDVYRGKCAPERNILQYALFVGYFPQMIQGPINRFSQLQEQLISLRGFDAENIRSGILRMLWGMLKKVFIADLLAPAVTEIYANFSAYSGAIVLLGSVLYCIQLYCDFSGGVDVVCGASELFGIRMAENFKRPYFADSLDEFWRRWHISLGEWMKDYLFYPVALSKWMTKLSKRVRGRFGADLGKLLAPCAATVIVFLAVGVWQGPGLQNIAYGLWNGCLMSGAMLLAPRFRQLRARLKLPDESKALHVFRILRTLLLVVIGRYFSRADSLMSALRMIKRTILHFTWNLSPSALLSFGLGLKDYIVLAVSVLILLAVSLLQERGVCVRAALAKKPAAVQFLLLFAGILLLLMFVYLNGDYTAIAYVYENV